jgi:fluoride exporter
MMYALIFVGAGIGGVVRQIVSESFIRVFGSNFPVGTLAINVLGSILMGVTTAIFAMRSGLSQEARVFLTTGFLGGFTTFSTFSLDAVTLWENGHPVSATLYLAASLGLSFFGLMAGITLVRMTH